MSEADGRRGWGTSRGPLVGDHDVVLLDLDGVVYVGPQAVPGAAEALTLLRERGVRVGFVTNNASRTPAQVARQLASLSIQTTDDDVVTSAQAAARLLAGELDGGARVLVVGAAALREAVSAAGLTPVDRVEDDPVAVVQGFSPELCWAMLDEACVAVRRGLLWVATNLDATLPTPRGPAPGNGAFVEVVARTTGATPHVAGKPARALLAAAVERTGARRPLFVGDRLDTDMAGANAAGVAGLHVLTGSSAALELLAAAPERRPTYLAADLAGLLSEHRAPQVRCHHSGDGDEGVDGHEGVHGDQRDDGDQRDEGDHRDDRAWTARGREGVAARWSRDDGLHVAVDEPDDTTSAVEVLRVACAAVWAASDAGSDVDLEQAGRAVSPWTAPQGWDR